MNANQSTRKLRSLKSIVAEDALLTLLMFAFFLYFIKSTLNIVTLMLVMLVYIIRVFTIRHEKSHLGNIGRTAVLDFFSNYFSLYHTPYQEPYFEKRTKHLLHHKSHTDGEFQTDFSKDPHYILEHGSWLKALVASVFYEEVMFYLDFKRYGGLSEARKKLLPVAVIMVGLQIAVFGITNFLMLMASYRFGMALVWYFFSYIMHMSMLYGHTDFFKNHTPRFILHGSEILMGSSHATVVMFHKFHHDYPNKFIDFSTDAYKNDPTV